MFLLLTHSKYKYICNLTECPSGKWGKSCEMDCMCQNGATCDPFDGKCLCNRGWTGKYCSQECPPDRYGQDCGEECRCRNGGSCHHISGECHCAPGYTGPLLVDLSILLLKCNEM